MNKRLTRKEYLKLLELLENNIITREKFYILLELKENRLEDFFKILDIEGLEEKNELLDKLLMCDSDDDLHMITYFLKNNQDIRNNKEKRNYVIDNIKSPNIHNVVKLLKYDFIFNDEDLLDKLINFNKPGRYYTISPLNMITKHLMDEIKQNLDLYYDGSKNKYIEMALELPNDRFNFSILFIELIKCKTFLDNPKWFQYIQECFTVNDRFNIEYISYIVESSEKNGKTDILNQKLEELDNITYPKLIFLSNISELPNKKNLKEFKLLLFDRLINNLYLIDYTVDDETFKYLMDKVFESEEMFTIYLNYKNMFTDDSSPCKEGTEMYNTLMDCEYIENIAPILDGLSTSLSQYIDIEFLKKCITDKDNTAESYLVQLAIDKGNIEYIKTNKPQLLVEHFSNEFIEYMSVHPDLTIEEILKQKQIVKDAKPVFKNGSCVVDIPVEKNEKNTRLKGKVKRIGKKYFLVKR